jgi:phosphoribosylformimino-5-aminoimidazole carboxamide ribotide isomerase
LATWGAQKLILGADCSDGKIAISGWASMTDLELHEFVAAYLAEGFLKVVSTDISKDGMLGGPATNMYVQLLEEMRERALPIELIASGGIRNLVDLDTLSQAGLYGAIIGKALYEGKIDADQLATWQAAGSGLDVG